MYPIAHERFIWHCVAAHPVLNHRNPGRSVCGSTWGGVQLWAARCEAQDKGGHRRLVHRCLRQVSKFPALYGDHACRAHSLGIHSLSRFPLVLTRWFFFCAVAVTCRCTSLGPNRLSGTGRGFFAITGLFGEVTRFS